MVGKYRFVKNGVEIFNSLNLTNLNANNFPYASLIYSEGYVSDTIFDFNIVDMDKGKYCKAQIKLLSPILEQPNGVPTVETGAELQWKLSLLNAPYIEEQFSSYNYTSYPTKIILKKQ